MANTLGWDDDLDSCIALEAIEKCFDIDFSEYDLRHVRRIGDLFDVVWRKLQSNGAGRKCASAMMFYRLRSALDLAVWRHEKICKPGSDLAWFDRCYTNEFVKTFERAYGLRLPKPRLSFTGKIGLWSLLLTVAWFPFAALVERLGWSLPDGTGVVYLIATVALMWCLIKFDPGRLPEDFDTVGDLVEDAVKLNYGRLVKLGADGREEEVWRMFLRVLADHSCLAAEEMTRDTVLLASTFDDFYSAAA